MLDCGGYSIPAVWSNGVIPFVVYSNLPGPLRELMFEAARHIANVVPTITWRPRIDSDVYEVTFRLQDAKLNAHQKYSSRFGRHFIFIKCD
jgi:hypothetical protein